MKLKDVLPVIALNSMVHVIVTKREGDELSYKHFDYQSTKIMANIISEGYIEHLESEVFYILPINDNSIAIYAKEVD